MYLIPGHDPRVFAGAHIESNSPALGAPLKIKYCGVRWPRAVSRMRYRWRPLRYSGDIRYTSRLGRRWSPLATLTEAAPAYQYSTGTRNAPPTLLTRGGRCGTGSISEPTCACAGARDPIQQEHPPAARARPARGQDRYRSGHHPDRRYHHSRLP